MEQMISKVLARYSGPIKESAEPEDIFAGLLTAWAIRVFLAHGRHKLSAGRLSDELIKWLQSLGFEKEAYAQSEPEDREIWLLEQLDSLTGRLQSGKLAGSTLLRNLENLQEMAELDSLQLEIIVFVVLKGRASGAESELLLNGHSGAFPARFLSVLSIALNRRPADVKNAVYRRDGLNGSFLRRSNTGFDLVNGLSDALQLRVLDQDELLKFCCSPASPTNLGRGDFPHLSRQLNALSDYLRQQRCDRRVGVNLLFHGVPGTGKTEFSRLLAACSGMSLYELSNERENGESLGRAGRLSTYSITQRFLRKASDALILFDETEEVFPGTRFMFFDRDTSNEMNKAWFNDLLENNEVPTIWITNKIDRVDPAYIRRFDYVLEFPIPPRSVRERILRKCTQGMDVSDEWILKQAEDDRLAPAVVETAARFARATTGSGCNVEAAVQESIGNVMHAMGEPARPSSIGLGSSAYSMEYLNPSRPLPPIVDALKSSHSGRICLYGPPGTGKSGFARYVARELDRPLMIRRASDILSPFLGVAERNMARMFAEAQAERAVLLLDEADSLLRSRQGAQKSWEITQVNEMLSQMEVYEGVFFATTNLREQLDEASLRRFDAKIEFGYLEPKAVMSMFCGLLERQGINLDAGEQARWRQRLVGLDQVTPGDFANVERQAKFLGVELTPESILDHLVAEVEVKPGRATRAIGFTADIH